MVLFHHRSLSMVKEVGGMVLFHHRSWSIGKEVGVWCFSTIGPCLYVRKWGYGVFPP